MALVVEPNIDLHLEVEMLVPDHADAAMVIDQLPYLELVKVAEAIGAEPARMAEWARKVADEVIDAELEAELQAKMDAEMDAEADMAGPKSRWGQGACEPTQMPVQEAAPDYPVYPNY